MSENADYENEDRQWVVVSSHDKLLAGPFDSADHEGIVEAANEAAENPHRTVYVITEEHLRRLQGRWLPGLRFYKKSWNEGTQYIARTDTQFEARIDNPEKGHRCAVVCTYEDWKDSRERLVEMTDEEIEAMPDEVREDLRYHLMRKERKVERMLKRSYERGDSDVTQHSLWNELVRKRFEDEIGKTGATA